MCRAQDNDQKTQPLQCLTRTSVFSVCVFLIILLTFSLAIDRATNTLTAAAREDKNYKVQKKVHSYSECLAGAVSVPGMLVAKI